MSSSSSIRPWRCSARHRNRCGDGCGSCAAIMGRYVLSALMLTGAETDRPRPIARRCPYPVQAGASHWNFGAGRSHPEAGRRVRTARVQSPTARFGSRGRDHITTPTGAIHIRSRRSSLPGSAQEPGAQQRGRISHRTAPLPNPPEYRCHDQCSGADLRTSGGVIRGVHEARISGRCGNEC